MVQFRQTVRSNEPSASSLRAIRAGVLVSIIIWAGCNQIAGIYEGEKRSCSKVEDCDLGVAECRTAQCKAGECVYEDAPDGMLLSAQTSGDCVELQCDGHGQSKIVEAMGDVPEDNNACTVDECIGSMPRNQPLPWVDCYTGDPITRNLGICHDGRQACDEKGKPVGSCVGEVLPRLETCLTIYDDNCDGQINEATGADCVCATGSLQQCYGSTVGSIEVGQCVSGYQECTNGLGFGECKLQVTPSPESCATPWDDDCDGLINESGADCVCGDGFVSNDEQCDDGNTADGDGCSSKCTLPQCGNGTKEAGEGCDDGNTSDTDACTRQCKNAKCGDGFVENGVEACDDGNLVDTDGCTRLCALSKCGNGTVESELGEICDDGNLIGGDGCQEDCTPSPVALALGYTHSCALFSNGMVKCWGGNYAGELGLGDANHRGITPSDMGDKLPVVDLGLNHRATAIFAGDEHTCAILDDDSAKCWGRNDHGQLGLDDDNFRGDMPGSMGDSLPTIFLGDKVKTMSLGHYRTCAILQLGKVKCWGNAAYGSLGLGGTNDWGNKPGDMATLPIVPVSVGTRAISIMSAVEHSCLIQDDLVVRCWGNGFNGELGQGNMTVYGDDPGEEGGVLVDIGMNKIPSALSQGFGFSTCIRLLDGRLTCWGDAGYCQLGIPYSGNIGDKPGDMGNALAVADVGVGKTVLEAGLGLRHQCALLSGGIVRCWGANDIGQSGSDPGCSAVGDARPPVDLGPGFVVTHLAVGSGHNCAISTNGRIKCWGWNEDGQLGLGDTNDRGDNPGELGQNLPPVRLW